MTTKERFLKDLRELFDKYKVEGNDITFNYIKGEHPCTHEYIYAMNEILLPIAGEDVQVTITTKEILEYLSNKKPS